MRIPRPEMRLIQLSGWSVLDQLRLEEALVRTDMRNWCLINTQAPPAIVLGISGRLEQLIDLHHYSQRPVPLIRRFSGGGTVVVDPQTLFVTLVCQKSAVEASSTPEAIMKWTSRLCPSPISLRENDYVIGQHKCGGNAQYLRRDNWLHHTTYLWDYDPQLMSCLQLPSRRPEYRQARAHEDFLVKLKDHFDSRDQFISEILQRLGDHFTLAAADENELQEITQRPHRQATQSLGPILASSLL